MPHVVKVYDEVNAKTAHILSGITYTFEAMVEGSSYTGNLQTVPILNSTKKEIGWFDSSSCTFTGDVFTTEKEEELNVLSNGDYYLDYKTGYYNVIAATSATPTVAYTTYMIAIASVVDVELGAVELKNAITDDRATINAANTARTTGTTVLVTQELDATGKVSPAGDTVGNAPFVKIGDGTDTLDILIDNASFPTGTTTGIAVFGRYQATPSSFTDGDAAPILLDSNGRVVLSADIEIGAVELKDGSGDTRANINVADTVRTTGTTVLAVQEIGADGTVPPTGSLLTNAPFIKITDATTNVDVLPLVTGTTSSGLLSVAGEIVDFDTTAAEDPTPSIGILGMSSVGAKPILVDGSGRTNIDIATQTLTAVKISKDANANAVGNPIFAELSNGSSAFTATVSGTTVALDVNLVSGLDVEIGAVELKDGTTDTRATINAANTSRTTGTTVLAVQTVDAAGKVFSSNGFRIIEEGSLTITTAGTPVACSGNTSAKAVRVINNNVDGTILAVGLIGTVDAVSSPPIGVVLTAYSSVVMYVSANSNEIAVDSSTSLKTATVQILGV